MIKSSFVFLFLLILQTFSNESSYKITFLHKEGNPGCQILERGFVAQYRLLNPTRSLYVESFPQTLLEGAPGEEESPQRIFHVYAVDQSAAETYLNATCQKLIPEPVSQPEADEVIPLIVSGNPSNRIDLVFLGDGYTLAQKDIMIQDMKRLVSDIFTGETFTPYLPLFNVWIVWRPSVESGIGTGGKPRNTAFGLYRDGTELRGVYCSKAQAARDACKSTGLNACDFPTLIGNSPYYGGLGGEFTISTSSETSGTIVLRHELGHNFGQVGEEYDGGSAYFGANFANTLTKVTSMWGAWLTKPPVRVEDSVLRLQDYPWYLLENGPKTYTFTSDGNYKRWYLSFTASGCPEQDSLEVILDGQPLEWKATGEEDRTFYKYILPTGFTKGTHTITWRQKFAPTGNFKRQLCSLTLHEYKNDDLFQWENYYSAYKTWKLGNTLVGYRPSNELCLMRNMTSPYFCDVCIENMWLQFFKKVSLIDSVSLTCTAETGIIMINVIPLAHLRDTPLAEAEESYVLKWYKNGVHQAYLDDAYQWNGALDSIAGTWTARLNFITTQVRSDPQNLLTFSKQIVIPSAGPC